MHYTQYVLVSFLISCNALFCSDKSTSGSNLLDALSIHSASWPLLTTQRFNELIDLANTVAPGEYKNYTNILEEELVCEVDVLSEEEHYETTGKPFYILAKHIVKGNDIQENIKQNSHFFFSILMTFHDLSYQIEIIRYNKKQLKEKRNNLVLRMSDASPYPDTADKIQYKLATGALNDFALETTVLDLALYWKNTRRCDSILQQTQHFLALPEHEKSIKNADLLIQQTICTDNPMYTIWYTYEPNASSQGLKDVHEWLSTQRYLLSTVN